VQALLDQGDFVSAQGIIRELENEHSADPEVLGLLADFYEGQMMYEPASRFWSALVAADPGAMETREKLINYYIDSKRTAALISFFESAAAEEKSPDLFYYLAQIYSARRDKGDLERTYLATLKTFPKEEAAKRKLADIYESTGRSSAALVLLEQLFNERPQSREYAQRYVEQLSDLGKRAQTLAALDIFQKRFAANPAALLFAAQYYDRAGERRQALAILDRVAGITATDLRGWDKLGEVYFGLEDYEKAAEVLGRLHERTGGTYHSHHVLGDVLVVRGDRDAGRREYERALELVRQ
jgi:tetratricopeptide (TPR) repeat protein